MIVYFCRDFTSFTSLCCKHLGISEWFVRGFSCLAKPGRLPVYLRATCAGFFLPLTEDGENLTVRERAPYCENTLRERLNAVHLRVLPHSRVRVGFVGKRYRCRRGLGGCWGGRGGRGGFHYRGNLRGMGRRGLGRIRLEWRGFCTAGGRRRGLDSDRRKRIVSGGGGGGDLGTGVWDEGVGMDGLGEEREGETARLTSMGRSGRAFIIFLGGETALSGTREEVRHAAGVGGVILRLETTSEKRQGAVGGVPQMKSDGLLGGGGGWKWEGVGEGEGGWTVVGFGVGLAAGFGVGLAAGLGARLAACSGFGSGFSSGYVGGFSSRFGGGFSGLGRVLGIGFVAYKDGGWVKGVVVICLVRGPAPTEAGDMPQPATVEALHGRVGGNENVMASPRVRKIYGTRGSDVLGQDDIYLSSE